ncbi:MAG TPA: peptide ABC transporter ATP-binding protein [Ruminococcaceae bacterium]|jgi:oligopeptide transport system ATP-binding protein|nr:peptide ABC transporter ATP-binding protein [Oscillospiraceae bacterium]
MERILDIDDLYVSFDTYAGEVHAVRGVSLYVDAGEVLAIVGESGSGKSVTAQTVMKLNPMPPARIVKGKITLCGNDIVAASEKKMQQIRGQLVSMIFQDPMTSLNPTKKIGKQLTETLKKKKHLNKQECYDEALKLLNMVQIPNADERINQYPYEFSGGMRQRAMIAMALACKPKLLIADEPTTALDVTIQAQIMQLMQQIRDKTGTSIILITHDLGVVASLADRVAVMYAGKIVEQGSCKDIFYRQAHPYTRALLRSLPTVETSRNKELVSIPGTPPDLFAPPAGCAFASRCEQCMKICKHRQPPKFTVGEGHTASCWRLHPDFPGDKEEK